MAQTKTTWWAEIGTMLTVSGVLALIGALVNHSNYEDSFDDRLGNEIHVGQDTTWMLVVLGVILVMNGVVALVLGWSRERERAR